MSQLIFYILHKISIHAKFSNITYKLYEFFSKFLYVLLKLFKAKRNNLLERSSFSNSHFRKIFPEFYIYLDKFSTILNSNPVFPFALEAEKNIINDISNKQFKEFKESVIIKASQILNNNYQILGKTVNFTESINWSYSFSENLNWPLIKTNKLKRFIDNQEIDVKYSLRLNYHEEFVILGLAYYLTNKNIYVAKFEKLILDWIKKNPPNLGINWLDLLEISHRIINWLISLLLFGRSQFLNKDSLKVIAKSLYQQVYYINLYSNPYSFNHTIGEFFAIFLFSKIFKKFNSIKKWYYRSLNVLNKQIKKQIQEDGVHFEQATHYHRLVLEIFLLFLIIEPKACSTDNLKIIKKMLVFLKYIIKPDGSVPHVGDSDNSHFIPEFLLNREEKLNHYLLNFGAAFFEDPNFKIENYYSNLFIIPFLLGNNKFLKFIELKKESLKNQIKYFYKSGYLICKNDLSKKANYLFFDMGHFGPFPSSHDHSDISNLIYSFKGTPILIDSGTYKYNESQNSRNLFRSGKAHNILVINNHNQAKIIDKWTWINLPDIKKKIMIKKDKMVASICHNGYKNFVSERILEISRDFSDLVIRDKICSNKDPKLNQEITSYFNFPPTIKIEILNNKIKINSNLILSIKCENSLLNIIKKSSQISPFYGSLEKSSKLKVHVISNFNNKKPIKIYYHFHKVRDKFLH